MRWLSLQHWVYVRNCRKELEICNKNKKNFNSVDIYVAMPILQYSGFRIIFHFHKKECCRQNCWWFETPLCGRDDILLQWSCNRYMILRKNIILFIQNNAQTTACSMEGRTQRRSRTRIQSCRVRLQDPAPSKELLEDVSCQKAWVREVIGINDKKNSFHWIHHKARKGS